MESVEGGASAQGADRLVEMLGNVASAYGDRALPNYGRVVKWIGTDLYANEIRLIEKHFAMEEFTSEYLHVSRALFVDVSGQKFSTFLSFVGRYVCVCSPENGRPVLSSKNPLVEILRKQGFYFPGHSELECPIQIWPAFPPTPLFEFLFEFEDGILWEDQPC